MQDLDPLQTAVPLSFHQVLFPFGFAVHIRSNDQSIIRAAEVSWGSFKQNYGLPPLQVRFVVSDAATRRRPRIPSFRAQGNLLAFVADQANFACCDLASGFGFAFVTKASTTHRDYIRHHFVEPIVYTMLDTRYTISIHAACVALNGHGVLLTGDSGAGKSSLAYACAKRGWSYMCDDATAMVLHSAGRRVVGDPQTLRFKPAGLTLFPEIKGRRLLRNGRPSIEVRTETLPGLKSAYECSADHIIFLKRGEPHGNRPFLTPVSRQEAFRRISKNPWPGELAIQERRTQAVERLLTAEVHELAYWDFDPAIDLLEKLVGGGTP